MSAPSIAGSSSVRHRADVRASAAGRDCLSMRARTRKPRAQYATHQYATHQYAAHQYTACRYLARQYLASRSAASRSAPTPRRARAFTLVEVLVVLVIVGLLSAIALPAYVSYVVQARRVEGQVALLLLMQQQERYFSENNTYLAFTADATDPAARRFSWWSGSSAASSAYEMAGQACEGQLIAACIELRATPGTDKVDSHFRDPACGPLSLSSDGSHKAGGNAEHCWP